MQKYKSNITTTSGAAVRGAPVLVIDEDGNNAALFLDRAGTVPAPNPLTTGPDGVFYFYAANGRYSIRTTVEGVTITDDDVVLMMDPEEITVAGPIAEAVAAAQAAAIAAEFAVEASGIPDLVAAAQNAVVDSNNAVTQANSAANNAAISKTGADSARDAAVIAKNAAEAALDSFDDRYLGAKAVAPTADNAGAALLTGALYWDTALPGMRSWNGGAWVTLPAATKASVGLANVDNTSDANKPVSTAQANAIALKADASALATWQANPTGVQSLNNGPLGGMRNKIINGSFSVNQRAYVSGAATTAGQYTFDRWKVTGTQGITFSTTNNKTTVTIPPGQTLQQVIEGLNLQSGTYVLSWEGTAQGRIGAGAYGASGTVTAAITGGANTTIEFNAGTVTAVQLEPGTVATPFEQRHYGAELALCQRYYEEVAYRVYTAIASAALFGSACIAYKATKRTLPTLSHKELNANNCIFNSFARTSVQGCTPTYDTASASGFADATLVANAEL